MFKGGEWEEQDQYLNEMDGIAIRLKQQIVNINSELGSQKKKISKVDNELAETRENMKSINGQMKVLQKALGK